MPRRNPRLPPAPPKRRFAGAPPTPARLSSSLERVRKLSRELDERERPFSPERPGSWRGSSRDLVVNSRMRSPKLSSGYAYELQPGNWNTWRDSRIDDWDTVVISDDDIQGSEFQGDKTIDGARCSVFWNQTQKTYYAQTKVMTGNPDVDPRDIPAHLHKAEINELPDHNGQDIGYSQGYRSKLEDGWYQVEYATGSDYSGGSVNESNYQVLGEMLEEHHPEDSEPVVWARTSGGHGTYGIVVRYGDLEEDVREAIDALEDYPLMDEEHHSNLELEQQGEAWENWGERDFIGECAKQLGIDRGDLEEAVEGLNWLDVFELAREKANVYWEDQNGEGQWIDMERVADKATTFLSSGELPTYATNEQADEYERLRKAVAKLQG